MSPEPVPAAVIPAGLLLSVPSSAVVLYAWLSCRRDDCPAVGQLAGELGWSARSVQRSLRHLQEAGWVVVTERRQPGGGQAPGRYELRQLPS